MSQNLIFFCLLLIVSSPLLNLCVHGHSHPHMISFQSIEDEWGWKHICGGVLLTPDKVLTSGACGAFYYPYIDLYPIRVVAGLIDAGAMGPDIQAIELHKMNWEFHPNFSVIQDSDDGRIFDFDFAIVNLESNFTLNEHIQVYQFSSDQLPQEPNGQCNYVTWGIPQSPSVGRELREVNLSISDHPTCAQDAPFNVSAQMICAQDVDGRLHFGQRGDPLFCLDEGVSYLTGINSWNVNYFFEPIATFKRGIFANIKDGLSWIESKLG